MADKRDEFIASLKRQLDEWNAKIDDLEQQARRRAEEAEVQADLGIADLRDRRDEVKRKIREIREAGDEAWDDLMTGAERARDELVSAFKRARSRYEEDTR